MRISYADETTAQKYARQALNHPFGVMTSKSDEAQMSTGAGMVFRNNIDWLANQYNECRMGVRNRTERFKRFMPCRYLQNLSQSKDFRCFGLFGFLFYLFPGRQQCRI